MISTRNWIMRPAPYRRWPHIALCLSTVVAYVAAFLVLIVPVGPAVGALAIIPVAAVGWYFGAPAGLVTALLCIPLNTLLLNTAGYEGWLVIFGRGGGPGTAALVVVGLVIGRLSDLTRELKQQISSRQRAEERTQVLANASQRLSAAFNPEEAGRIILSVADELVGWDACTFDLYSSEIDSLQPIVSIDTLEGKRLDVPPAYSGKPGPVVRRTIEQGGQLILRSRAATDGLGLVPFGDTSRPSESLMFVPLRHGAQVVGVLSIQSYTPMAYGRNDLETLQALADHCGSAIHRTRAEAKLRESERRYRLLFDHSLVATYLYDLATLRVIDANPAFLSMLGYTWEEALQLTIYDIVALDQETIDRAIEQLKKYGPTVFGERQWRRKDGALLDVFVSVSKIRHGEQDIAYVTAQDITARKQAERALRQAEKRYRTLFEGAPIMYVITRVTPDGPRIEDCNDMFLNELGYEREAVIGQPLAGFYDAASRDLLRHGGYDRALAGSFVAEERRLVARNGELRQTLLRAVPETDESGKPVGTRAMFLDITERKRAEEALQRRADEFAALYEITYDLATQADVPTLLQTIVTRARRLFGAPVGGMYFYDRQRHDMELMVAQGSGAPVGSRQALGEGVVGHVAQTRQPLIVEDYQTWPGRMPEYVRLGFRSMVHVPMLFGGELIGVLNVTEIGETTRQFTEADARLLSLLAAQAASAVHNARLLEEVHTRAEQLAASEDRLRTILEAEPECVKLVAADGTLVDMNPAGLAMVEAERAEQVVGHSVYGLVAPEYHAAFRMLNETVFRGQPGRAEFEVVGLRGTRRWMETHAVPLRDKESTVIAQLAVTRDITERKRAEAALRSAEAMFRNLVEQSLVGVYIIQDEKFPYANPKLAEIFGYTQAEIVTWKSVADLVAEEDQARVAENIWQRLQGGAQSTHYTFRGRRKDAAMIEVEVYGTRTEYNGRPAVIGTLLDVTERMQAAAQIQRQLQHITALRAVDMAITASIDLRLTLSILLDQVATQLHADAANILLLSPQSQRFEYAAGRGFRTAALQHTRLGLGEGYAGRAALEQRIISIPDLRHRQTDFLRSPSFAQEGFVAYQAAPLIAKGKVVGVLEILHRTFVSPDQEWLDFLEALAVQAAIAVDNASLFEDLQRSNAELTLAYDATIEGWSRALDLRDKETEGHTLRVTDLTLELARAMGVGETDLIHMRRGALLHDMGKMGIPDSILLKPGSLTEEEWAIMRKHPEYGYTMLQPIAYLHPALDIPYYHHEKWDGTGYPRGLKGEQIPLTARIFAVADVWDALTSDRPYRAAWPKQKALAHIREQAGKHFDPQVVQVFLNLPSNSIDVS